MIATEANTRICFDIKHPDFYAQNYKNQRALYRKTVPIFEYIKKILDENFSSQEYQITTVDITWQRLYFYNNHAAHLFQLIAPTNFASRIQ